MCWIVRTAHALSVLISTMSLKQSLKLERARQDHATVETTWSTVLYTLEEISRAGQPAPTLRASTCTGATPRARGAIFTHVLHWFACASLSLSYAEDTSQLPDLTP